MSNPYFVDITTPKSPFECYQMVQAAEQAPEKITPEYCRALLQSTNYPPVIEKMALQAISAAVSQNAYAQYRDVLLGIVAQRETEETIADLVKATAACNNDLETYNAAAARERGRFLLKGYDKKYGFDLIGSGAHVNLRYQDFAGYDELRFDDEAKIIDMEFVDHLPMYLDISSAGNAEEVSLSDTDMSEVKQLKFPENVKKINFSRTENLPAAAMQLQQYAALEKVNMSRVDFGGSFEAQWPRTLKQLDLRGAKNLPAVLDLRGYTRLENLDVLEVSGTEKVLLGVKNDANVIAHKLEIVRPNEKFGRNRDVVLQMLKQRMGRVA